MDGDDHVRKNACPIGKTRACKKNILASQCAPKRGQVSVWTQKTGRHFTWARGLLTRLMNLFNKLPGFEQSPPGLEHRIWQRLPGILLLGSALPVALSLANRGLAWFTPWLDASDEKALMLWDYMMLGLVVAHWMLVIAVGVACFIVRVMKGPAYVADAYPLPDESIPPSDWQ